MGSKQSGLEAMNKEAPHPEVNSAGRIIAATLAFGLAYAVVRYHVVGPVPWKDLPFFILNKGIALSAFLLRRPRQDLWVRQADQVGR